jgi:hypothetical protein
MTIQCPFCLEDVEPPDSDGICHCDCGANFNPDDYAGVDPDWDADEEVEAGIARHFAKFPELSMEERIERLESGDDVMDDSDWDW